ncbi:MAG TPA: hypothetical protein VIJ14_11175 [Rhabdochlamydiaceae bacterium]
MDRKGWIFIALALFSVIFVLSCSPIYDGPDVNVYADQRSFLGIPNFFLVAPGVLFLFFGLMGLWKLGHQKKTFLRAVWMIFFLAAIGISLGSSYYHLDPSEQRLFWDRLSISTAFMALLAGVVTERISLNTAKKVAPFLILAGMASIFYWGGSGDVRFYYLIQCFSIIALPLLCLCFPMKGDKYIYGVVIFYILAKVVEVYDGQIFSLTHQMISGLTLKQLGGVVGVYFVYRKSCC